MCQFDEARDYRIVGTRGTLPYFVMAVLTAPAPADLAMRDWAAESVEGLKRVDRPIAGAQRRSVALANPRTSRTRSFFFLVRRRGGSPGKRWQWTVAIRSAVDERLRRTEHELADQLPLKFGLRRSRKALTASS